MCFKPFSQPGKVGIMRHCSGCHFCTASSCIFHNRIFNHILVPAVCQRFKPVILYVDVFLALVYLAESENTFLHNLIFP